MKYNRAFVIVLDSMGMGEMPDAADFDDAGCDTLGHIAETVESFNIPNLRKLGLANLKPMKGVDPVDSPIAYYASLKETSRGKDTMTGHWEMMGINTTEPFITFEKFPEELIKALEDFSGRKVVGNKPSSGTEIIEELAHEEIHNNSLICYTSADSVLQICGNEETMGVEELYRICEYAREITLKPEWRIGRVIARPYVGSKPGEYKRTANRHDYALKPSGLTVLNSLKDANYDVISVGKIADIFCEEGITEGNHSDSSVHGMEQTIEIAKRDFRGLCFTNLVDFDALWGHRRNPEGYAAEIERFDVKLGELLPLLKDDDLLILTADHGNDPTYKGTDHTREKVPFIAYSPSMSGNGMLDEQDNFAVIGATLAENFGVDMPKGTIGTSILSKLV